MSMSFCFTDAPQQFTPPEDEEEIWELIHNDPDVTIMSHLAVANFPEAAYGLDMSLENSHGQIAVRARSNLDTSLKLSIETLLEFEEFLAKNLVGISSKNVKAHPDDYRGRVPFFALFNNFGYRHLASPATVRILAGDFRRHHKDVVDKKLYDSGAVNAPLMRSIFQDFAEQTSQCAKRGGMIITV